MVGRANCVIALRSEGVSLLLDVSAGQLPAIVHWGADLGTLELADAEALILSNIDPGGPNVVDEPIRLALLPEHWTGWVAQGCADLEPDGTCRPSSLRLRSSSTVNQ